MPCLITSFIDEDLYFRMTTRDVSPKIGLRQTCNHWFQFFPALQDCKAQRPRCQPVMPTVPFFVTDTAEDVKRKINKYAFSGGQTTKEEHRCPGFDCEVDTSPFTSVPQVFFS